MRAAGAELATSPKRRWLSERALSGVVALGTGVVLGLAVWLEPAVAGHSTHTQLGLSPCTFLSFTGYPCPMCGATTTFALMADLRPLAALSNQPFAAFLFVSTVGAFGVSLAEVLQPRGRWGRIGALLAPIEGRLAVGFLAFMALGWVYKIVAMS